MREIQCESIEGVLGCAGRDEFLELGEIVESYETAGELRPNANSFAKLRERTLLREAGSRRFAVELLDRRAALVQTRPDIHKAAVGFGDERHIQRLEDRPDNIRTDHGLPHAEV